MRIRILLGLPLLASVAACTLYFNDPGSSHSGGPPPPVGTPDAGTWESDGGGWYPDAGYIVDAGYVVDATSPSYPDAPPCCDPHPDAAVAGGGCSTP